MMNPIKMSQKVMLKGKDPVVLLRGKRAHGVEFFVYLEIELSEYNSLVRDPSGFDRADNHGIVIVERDGVPDADVRAYMEKYYDFDHSQIEW